jgi:hypothetical protein
MKVNGVEVGNTADEMLETMIKRSGGKIPAFARDLLKSKMGYSDEQLRQMENKAKKG